MIEIKTLYSPDVHGNLDTWQPANAKNVHFLLELDIGEEESESADIFEIIISTPKGLAGALEKFDLEINRNIMIFRNYSYDGLTVRLNQIIQKCESDSWIESVLKLQRYFAWEYEDFVMEKE